jgi:hypothetical protein
VPVRLRLAEKRASIEFLVVDQRLLKALYRGEKVAGCIEQMDYEILLKNATFKETSHYINEHANKVYYVGPGFKVFDRRLIGIPPVPVGVGPSYIMLTYVKPCYGSFVLKLPRDEEEVARIVAEDKKYKAKRKNVG